MIERRKKYKLRFVYIKKDYLLGISYDELVLDVSSLKRVFCFEIKLDMYRFHSFKLSSIHTFGFYNIFLEIVVERFFVTR